MVTAPINLISLDERGIAYVAGTRMKVAQIVRERIGLEYTPADIIESHSLLTLAQVHAALSYYYCHKEEIDAYLLERDDYVEESRRRNKHQVSREELEARLALLRQGAASSTSSELRVAEEGVQYD